MCKMTTDPTRIYHRTKLSTHLGKAAPNNETRLAGAMIRTRVRAAVVQDAEKGKRAKRDDQSRSSRAKDKDAKCAPLEIEIQHLRSKPLWCPAHPKSNCQKGECCPYPHLFTHQKMLNDAKKDTQKDKRKNDPT